MTNIEKAAMRVHKLFWNNTGNSDEWPIQIKADDDIYDEVADALNGLFEAIEEKYPGSCPWPIKS